MYNVPPEDDGRDKMHWFIHTKEPQGSRQDKVASYINLVASVLGSKDEAKKVMYYSGIGLVVPENVAQKFNKHPDVLHVLEDTYVDPMSKDYGGEQSIGQGMIREGITGFPALEAYERLLKEYNTKEEKKLKDANKPKKPPRAFYLFMQDFRKQFKEC